MDKTKRDIRYTLLLILIVIFLSALLNIIVDKPSSVDARQLVTNGIRRAGAIFTTVSNGVPAAYTKQTGSGFIGRVQKGRTNILVLRPQIINEHCESQGTVQDIIDVNTIVGQSFKASQNNINGIVITLESAAGVVVDDFESYADSAALRVQWPVTGTQDANLETTIIHSGSKSMNLPMDTLNDEWADTFATTDYTGYTFDLDYYQDKEFNKAKMSFFLEDSSTNTASIQLILVNKDQWEHFEINVGALSDDGAATDLTDIIKIGFRVDDKEGGKQAYVDNLIGVPSPGEIDVKLWDYGATPPVAASNTINSAAQYTELGDRGKNGGAIASSITLSLVGGKRQYQLDGFVAGVAKEKSANTLLTVDNYYAITLHYVDTDVNVYGSSGSSDHYINGYSFTAPNVSTPITAVGADQDCMFIIYSTQDVYIINSFWTFFTDINTPATTGINASHSMFVESSTEVISDILVTTVKAGTGYAQPTEVRPMFMDQGGKYEMYYSDDFDDDVYVVQFAIGYLYQLLNSNG